MRKIFVISLLCLILAISSVYAANDSLQLLNGINHLKQSTLRFAGDRVLYFDPIGITGEPQDADIVFVTHTHGDHYSMADLKRVMKPGATLVAPADKAFTAKNDGFNHVLMVEPGKDYQVKEVKFSVVPAYNTNKNFHPQDNKWVGYIISFKGYTYYIPGDTDVIPEMNDIKADVVFLPVGGTYTMDATEAAQAANIIKPKVAVPIHFADIVGSWDDAGKFIAMLDKDIQGIILKQK